MDEFCSAVGDSNSCFHIDGSENLCVTDHVRVSGEDSSGASCQDDLVCFQCSGEQKSSSVASSASQRCDPSVSGSAYEATDDRDTSVFHHGLYMFSYSLNPF